MPRTPASVFIVLHRLRVTRPTMLISVMVSAPYSSLSAVKRFSLESPEDTHRARQTITEEERSCQRLPIQLVTQYVCVCVHKHTLSIILDLMINKGLLKNNRLLEKKTKWHYSRSV